MILFCPKVAITLENYLIFITRKRISTVSRKWKLVLNYKGKKFVSNNFLAFFSDTLKQGCPTRAPATISSFLVIMKVTKKSSARLLKDISGRNQ